MLPNWLGVAQCKMTHKGKDSGRETVYASGEKISVSFDYKDTERRFVAGDDVIVCVYRIEDEGLPARFQELDLGEVDRLRKRCKFLEGQLTEMSIDLGLTEENPSHYEGDGIVSCSRAMRSMLSAWERVPNECAYWATTSFKYLWRFPLKGHPREDLMKALDCIQRALDAWERNDDAEIKEQIASLKEDA